MEYIMPILTDEEADALDEELTRTVPRLTDVEGPFIEIFDPFYSEKNQAELKRRISDIEAGKNTALHE
jgi:hypothetical protein